MSPEQRSRLTAEGQRVLDRAAAEAKRFNHNYIGTEHLLLALVGGEETTASRVLRDLRVDEGNVRSAIEFIIGRGDRAPVGQLGPTPRTRVVLIFAIAEAEQLGQSLAGPEHLLLGLIREGEGIAAGVLESLGVSMAAARRQTLLALGLPPDTGATEGTPERGPRGPVPPTPTGPGPTWPGGWERKERPAMQNDRFDKFSQRARQVLALAQEEAQRFNHNYIGTEHLLLGLVREGEGVAAKVLSNLGVELHKVRNAIEFKVGRGDRAPVGEIGLTPRARKVIELAVDEARRLGHHYIGTEHLLLGLVREGEGIAAGVLESLGVNLEKVRQQTIMVRSQSGEPSAAARWQGRGSVQRTTSIGQEADLGTLRRVVPLAQMQEHGEVNITALSLEDYEHGFRLLLRVLNRDPAQPIPPIFRLPFPGLAASDDGDRRYTVRRGNGRSGAREQRFELDFTPALDPAARQLRLEIAPADQPRPEAAAPLPAEAEQGGSWTFTLTLPG